MIKLITILLVITSFNLSAQVKYLKLQNGENYGNGIQIVTSGDAVINNSANIFIYNNSSTTASATITLPSSPVNGQQAQINFISDVTSLTIAPNTGQIISQPFPITTVSGGEHFSYRWISSISTWVRSNTTGVLSVPESIGGGGSGTVSNVATGLGLLGGPITSTGTIRVDTSSLSILSRQRAAATYALIGSGGGGTTYTASAPITLTGSAFGADTSKSSGKLATFTDVKRDRDSLGALIATNTTSIATLSPSIIVSSAGTLTLTHAKDYVFSGTTTTWTLPAIDGAKTGRAQMITIKNRGSGNITLNTASGSTLYTTALASTLAILPGEAYTLMPDGTYFNVE